jgi:hypothetical protein
VSVEERDDWECLLADWSTAYAFSISPDEAEARPVTAAPRDDPEAAMSAATPSRLRIMVSEHHARRTAEPARPVVTALSDDDPTAALHRHRDMT